MTSFDNRYWNLSQAAAWVVYRSRALVDSFAIQSSGKWRRLVMYPTMHSHKALGSIDALRQALISGRLEAMGRRREPDDKLEAIPAADWADLTVSPPRVTRQHHTAGTIEPWTDVRFESADLKRLWRGVLETTGRTRYHWDVLKNLWLEINERMSEASKNEKILELQAAYEALGHKSAPARSTIQRHLARWK